MDEWSASDLAVIIPTHGRPEILHRTLDALEAQTAQGFEILVVVDGRDQPVPAPRERVTVIVQDQAGPGAARNHGSRSVSRPLVLFLGDDMVPTRSLVQNHLAGHNRHPGREDAVLGHVNWHPDMRRNPVVRWLERPGTQFDYPNIVGEDAGWGRFYSCNVSLKRSFFLSSGGFDEAFTFDYEDLDCAYGLHRAGLRLWYERDAIAHHLHPYDFRKLARRYESRARGEHLMMRKHEWFQPFYKARIESAAAQRPVGACWTELPEGALDVLARGPLRERISRTVDLAFHQRLAPHFLASWDAEADRDVREALAPRPAQAEQANGVDVGRSPLAVARILQPIIRPGVRVLLWDCRSPTLVDRLARLGAKLAAPESSTDTGWMVKAAAQRCIRLDSIALDVSRPTDRDRFDIVVLPDALDRHPAPTELLDLVERCGRVVLAGSASGVGQMGPDALLAHAARSWLLWSGGDRVRRLVVYAPDRPTLPLRAAATMRRARSTARDGAIGRWLAQGLERAAS